MAWIRVTRPELSSTLVITVGVLPVGYVVVVRAPLLLYVKVVQRSLGVALQDPPGSSRVRSWLASL